MVDIAVIRQRHEKEIEDRNFQRIIVPVVLDYLAKFFAPDEIFDEAFLLEWANRRQYLKAEARNRAEFHA